MSIASTIANRHRGLTRDWHILAARIPRTLTAILREASDHDGYKHTASGADTGPHSHSDTSSTEAAVLHRLETGSGSGPVEDAWEIDDYLRSIDVALRNIARICDKHGTPLTPSDLERLRCIGTGTPDGAVCTDYADPNRRDGRCTRCGPSYDRAQKANYDRRRYLSRVDRSHSE